MSMDREGQLEGTRVATEGAIDPEKQKLSNLIAENKSGMKVIRDFLRFQNQRHYGPQKREDLTINNPILMKKGPRSLITIPAYRALLEAFIEAKRQQAEEIEYNKLKFGKSPSESEKAELLNANAIEDLKHFCAELKRNEEYIESKTTSTDPDRDKKFAEATLKTLEDTDSAYIVYSNHKRKHVNVIRYQIRENKNGTTFTGRDYYNTGGNSDKDEKQLNSKTQKIIKNTNIMGANEGIKNTGVPAIRYLVTNPEESIKSDIRNSGYSNDLINPLSKEGNLEGLEVINPVFKRSEVDATSKLVTSQTGPTCSGISIFNALRGVVTHDGFSESNLRDAHNFMANMDADALNKLLNLPKPNLKIVEENKKQSQDFITVCSEQLLKTDKVVIEEIWNKVFEEAIDDPTTIIPTSILSSAQKSLVNIIKKDYSGHLTGNIQSTEQLIKDLRKEIHDSPNTPNKFKYKFIDKTDKNLQLQRTKKRQNRQYTESEIRKYSSIINEIIDEKIRQSKAVSPTNTYKQIVDIKTPEISKETRSDLEKQKSVSIIAIKELQERKQYAENIKYAENIIYNIDKLIDITKPSMDREHDGRDLTDKDVKGFYDNLFKTLGKKIGPDIDLSHMKNDLGLIRQTTELLNNTSGVENKKEQLNLYVGDILSSVGEEKLAEQFNEKEKLFDKARIPHILDTAETIEYVVDPQVKKHAELIEKITKGTATVEGKSEVKARTMDKQDVVKIYQGLINVSGDEQKQPLEEFKKENKEAYDKMIEDTTKLLNMNVNGVTNEDKLYYTMANLYASAGQDEIAKEVMKKIPKSTIDKLDNIADIKEIHGLQKPKNKSNIIESPSSEHGKKKINPSARSVPDH